MSSVLATYSAKDVNVALANSALGVTIAAAGVAMVGMERLTIRMATTQTVLAVAADGAVAGTMRSITESTIDFLTLTMER